MRGAAILAATAILSKIISGLYKIPLFSMLDDTTAAYYQVSYTVYMLLIAVSTAGIPVALSRLVSSASALGNKKLVRRYFAVSLPVFALLGLVLMLLVFRYADNLAGVLSTPDAASGIRILAPAIFFGCVAAVYRGYMQGHSKMFPTAVSQLIEVGCKAVFGLIIAWYLISNSFPNPTVSAGAIAGVAIGLAIGIPVLIYYKRKTDRVLHLDVETGAQDAMSRRAVLAQVLRVSIPITLGSAFISLMSTIDTSIVKWRLVAGAGFLQNDADALYGVYSKGLSLLNLSSALIVPITVAIIPVIAAAITRHQHGEARDVTESSLKLANIIAMPAGIGITVLAAPIYAVLYPSTESAMATGAKILSIFGVASYFVCMQLITTAVLQANGREKVPVFSYTVGGLIQIAVDYVLVSNPDINILGSPIGTLACYVAITFINLIFIVVKVKGKPNFSRIFVKPLLCTAVMGVAARVVYELLYKIGSPTLGAGRLSVAVYMAAAILAAIIVYAILIVATKTVTRDDMRYVPKGDKVAKFLKIK
jgi:stage V sporulation protein B